MNNNARGLTGALVTGIAGVAAGYVAGAINNPKPPVYKEPEPICGCGHHQSFHNQDGCNETIVVNSVAQRVEPQIETKRDKEGISRSKTLVPGSESIDTKIIGCGCKRYVGPEHYPSYVAGS